MAGAGSLVWLVLVGLPLYVMLAATLRTRQDYAEKRPGLHPGQLHAGQSTPAPSTRASASTSSHTGRHRQRDRHRAAARSTARLRAIVRSRGRTTSAIFRLFLLGLAIPAQAVIVPMFYLISEAGLYDNLLGVILPTAAFCLPMSALILSGAMRDISPELYEAMAMGRREPAAHVLPARHAAVPAGVSTIVVFSALQAWNGPCSRSS